MEKQQRQQVEKNMREARDKLESEMEDAFHEHQASMLRQGKCSCIFTRWDKMDVPLEMLNTWSATIKCVDLTLPDLLRRQEELRRMEEVHSQEMQKRKEMQIRYLFIRIRFAYLRKGFLATRAT